MASVEIDENELIANRELVTMVNRMLAHPESRRMLQMARKKAEPNVMIPELDAQEPVMDEVRQTKAELAAIRKELADERAAQAENSNRRKAEKQWNAGRSKLRDSGYLDDGIERVEKLMEERGIADHEAAAALFEKINPTPEAVTPNGFGMFDLRAPESQKDDNLRMLFSGDEDGFLRKMIPETLAEVRQGSRR